MTPRFTRFTRSIRISRLLRGYATLIALLVVAGCAPRPTTVHPMLCYLGRPGIAGRAVRPVEWVQLLTRTESAGNRVFADRDCTGTEIAYEPPDRDCIVKSPLLEAPKPTALRDGDVYERTLPDQLRLVWVVTHHFANGDGFGPVAVVRVHPNGLEVEAIGDLRMRTERVNLELWRIGLRAVVVASGETCLSARDLASCQRAANVLVHMNRSLFSPMLSFPNGRCIDEPWIELKREENLPVDSGWNRNFEIRSALSHDERYLVISEQVVVRDSDPESPEVPAREVRRIDTQRFIHLQGARLVTRQHPLWPRVLPSAGSLEVDE